MDRLFMSLLDRTGVDFAPHETFKRIAMSHPVESNFPVVGHLAVSTFLRLCADQARPRNQPLQRNVWVTSGKVHEYPCTTAPPNTLSAVSNDAANSTIPVSRPDSSASARDPPSVSGQRSLYEEQFTASQARRIRGPAVQHVAAYEDYYSSESDDIIPHPLPQPDAEDLANARFLDDSRMATPGPAADAAQLGGLRCASAGPYDYDYDPRPVANLDAPRCSSADPYVSFPAPAAAPSIMLPQHSTSPSSQHRLVSPTAVVAQDDATPTSARDVGPSAMIAEEADDCLAPLPPRLPLAGPSADPAVHVRYNRSGKHGLPPLPSSTSE
jgi:hypothetical protein